MAVKARIKKDIVDEKKLDSFISRGGSTPTAEISELKDHRLTLRIPQEMLNSLDELRSKRKAKISRTVLILDMLEKSISDMSN